MVLVSPKAAVGTVLKAVPATMATFSVVETASQSPSVAAATTVPTTPLEKASMSETPAHRNVLALLVES